MSFIDYWQTQLDSSLAEFAQLATTAQHIDFVYGILAAAVLWPVCQPVKQFNLEAIQAVQQVAGAEQSGPLLSLLQSCPADRLEVAQTLASQARANAQLRAAVAAIIDYFNASTAMVKYVGQHLGRPVDTGNLTVSNVNVGQISTGHIISGIMQGDIVGGDKIGGDRVGRDKITAGRDNVITYHITNIFGGSAPRPKPETPPLPFEPETVLIPAGPFLMGSSDDDPDEAPQHQLDLPDFRLGKYPVTNRQYAEFIKQSQHEPPEKPRWFARRPPADKLDHPVTGVSWYDALAYCRWLTEQTGGARRYRLPTEAEWEKAARGPKGRRYPWGNTWQDGCANAGSNDTAPVVSQNNQGDPQPNLPQGASPFGCYHMLGNVQEWTSTLWGSDLSKNAFPYPYRADDGREDLEAERHMHRVYRVHRGGSFRDMPAKLRCTMRGAASPDGPIRWRGFRIVLEV